MSKSSKSSKIDFKRMSVKVQSLDYLISQHWVEQIIDSNRKALYLPKEFQSKKENSINSINNSMFKILIKNQNKMVFVDFISQPKHSTKTLEILFAGWFWPEDVFIPVNEILAEI